MEIETQINELAQRRQKLEQLRQGGQAFPNDFKRAHLAADLVNYSLECPHHIKVAGRMMRRRLMGKASFFHLQDMSGQIQIYVREQDVSQKIYEDFKQWDLGDIIGVEGELFITKTGELSLKAEKIRLLTKALRPLPDKYHGLTDQETRYRQRYLDLLANEQTKKTFKIRSQIIQAIRDYLTHHQFMEVETPMMHAIPGGASARPFMTHHNALDMKLYLRIAPELYLKRLVVGGFERVFEINRNFRNEGISTRHNPEFTMLEFYQAYADYHDLINLTEDLLKTLAQKILGKTTLTYQDEELDFGKPFQRMTVKEAILHYNSQLNVNDIDNYAKLYHYAQQLGIEVKSQMGIGKLQIEIFEKTVEAKLKQPTFITQYPLEVSPLARANDACQGITDRFEFFVGGKEIANGFSELNDPDDQAARFKKQVEQLEAGDIEAMHYDSDYIVALEHGLPPSAGEGIGIDRLVMLFTDSPSIRDVILFPQMRKG